MSKHQDIYETSHHISIPFFDDILPREAFLKTIPNQHEHKRQHKQDAYLRAHTPKQAHVTVRTCVAAPIRACTCGPQPWVCVRVSTSRLRVCIDVSVLKSVCFSLFGKRGTSTQSRANGTEHDRFHYHPSRRVRDRCPLTYTPNCSARTVPNRWRY